MDSTWQVTAPVYEVTNVREMFILALTDFAWQGSCDIPGHLIDADAIKTSFKKFNFKYGFVNSLPETSLISNRGKLKQKSNVPYDM